MNNRPLTLAQLHQGLYQEHTASAYIYYGTSKNAFDHHGNSINEFMDDDKRHALEDHIRTVIMPKVQSFLTKTDYQCIDVDYVNMAPHPFLVITRHDRKNLEQTDLTNIHSLLTRFINQQNTAANQNGLLSRLFQPAQAEPINNQTKESVSRYNLRSLK